MIRRIALCAVAISCLAGAAVALDSPAITVTGTAVTDVVPDNMTWRLVCRERGDDAHGVARAQADALARVLDHLSHAGIDDRHLQTSDMKLAEEWSHQHGRRELAGYLATTDISFRTDDLTGYRDLWLSLSELPGLSIERVTYGNSSTAEVRGETRRKALLAARAKAADMAATLDVELAEPLLIEEVTEGRLVPSPSNVRIEAAAPAPDDASGLALGTIPVRATVKVSFRLVSGS